MDFNAIFHNAINNIGAFMAQPEQVSRWLLLTVLLIGMIIGMAIMRQRGRR